MTKGKVALAFVARIVIAEHQGHMSTTMTYARFAIGVDYTNDGTTSETVRRLHSWEITNYCNQN